MKTLPPKGRKNKGGRTFKYEFALMRKVVQDYLDGDQSLREVGERYNLPDRSVSDWVQRYNKRQEPFNEVVSPLMPDQTQQQNDNQTDLQQQNAELLKKLEYANLKITGLEIMIDVAEEQLGIDIRKKPGAKQSVG
jgi:transposase-like protein